MKHIIYILSALIISVPAFGAQSAARRSMASQVMSAPRVTASVNQLNAMANNMLDTSVSGGNAVGGTVATPDTPAAPEKPAVDLREKEKRACLANNIGVGNTFVWASRFSNVDNYASMVEDVENPENNTCFVFVELKSNDSKISVFDIDGKYYEMGDAITCGEWTDADKLKQRILDAKKNVRVWGTIGGAVGGAGIGVGAMELFGNKLIGGAVEGQKAMTETELAKSQVLTLKEKDLAQYKQFQRSLGELIAECDAWLDEASRPDECKVVEKYRHTYDENAY